MTDTPAKTYADEVQTLIAERLKIKGKTLGKSLSRAGRLLPKWAHREGRYIVQASEMMDHPKLRLMIDQSKLEKAHSDLVTHLKTIDPKERRKARVLSLLGAVSFNLIVVVVALITYLWWRGFV